MGVGGWEKRESKCATEGAPGAEARAQEGLRGLLEESGGRWKRRVRGAAGKDGGGGAGAGGRGEAESGAVRPGDSR